MTLRTMLGLIAIMTAAPAFAADNAAATVVKLYQEFGWETVIAHPRLPGLLEQPPHVLGHYFDSHLTALIVKDRKCASRTHAICALDFMPIWDAQDIGATDLSVTPTTDASVVSVQFTIAGNTKQLTYKLNHTGVGWRITDIQGAHGSLVSLLEKSP